MATGIMPPPHPSLCLYSFFKKSNVPDILDTGVEQIIERLLDVKSGNLSYKLYHI